jgi:hypothetical protein
MRVCLLLAVIAPLLVLPPTPSSAAASGETCDGIAAIQCGAGMWCEHAPGLCDGKDVSGTCVKVSGPFCKEDQDPVCACKDDKGNQVTYSNDCKRKVAKAQLDHVGECAKSP